MFEWDETKRKENLRKHGIDFADAAELFEGPVLSELDNRFPYGEARYVAYGILRDFVVAVAYTPRGDATRIISMRKATAHEQKEFFKKISH